MDIFLIIDLSNRYVFMQVISCENCVKHFLGNGNVIEMEGNWHNIEMDVVCTGEASVALLFYFIMF